MQDLEDFIVSNNLLPLGSLFVPRVLCLQRGAGAGRISLPRRTPAGPQVSKWARGYLTYALACAHPHYFRDGLCAQIPDMARPWRVMCRQRRARFPGAHFLFWRRRRASALPKQRCQCIAHKARGIFGLLQRVGVAAHLNRQAACGEVPGYNSGNQTARAGKAGVKSWAILACQRAAKRRFCLKLGRLPSTSARR